MQNVNTDQNVSDGRGDIQQSLHNAYFKILFPADRKICFFNLDQYYNDAVILESYLKLNMVKTVEFSLFYFFNSCINVTQKI